MGHDQHTSSPHGFTSRKRRLGLRVCLRKGCGCVFQARCWNQRYCQDPECLRLVRCWQAAKRQRRSRQNAECRQRHCEAERQRRKQRRDQAASTACAPQDDVMDVSPAKSAEDTGAWSRSKKSGATFCDRVGCYDPVRQSSGAWARYCGDDCRQAMRRVLDRERKWLRRNTDTGRVKRRFEYDRARSSRVTQPNAVPGTGTEFGPEGRTEAPSAGRHLSGFL
jgi:hypothetical protein